MKWNQRGFMAVAGALGTVLAVAATAAAQPDADVDQRLSTGTSVSAPVSPNGAQAYADRIKSDIVNDIRNNKTVNGQLQSVNIEVDNIGRFVIIGEVNTLEQRNIIMRIATEHAGKDMVVNQMSIRPPQ